MLSSLSLSLSLSLTHSLTHSLARDRAWCIDGFAGWSACFPVGSRTISAVAAAGVLIAIRLARSMNQRAKERQQTGK